MTSISRRFGVSMFVTVIAVFATACVGDDDADDDADSDDDNSDSDSNADDDVSDDESDDDFDGDDAADDEDDSECNTNQPPIISNVHYEVDGVETPLPITGDQSLVVTIVADYDDPDCNLAGGGLAYREETITGVASIPADLPCVEEGVPLRLSFFPGNFVEKGPRNGFLIFVDRCGAESDWIPFDTDIEWNPLLCQENHPTELITVTAFVNGVETPQPLVISDEDTVALAFAYTDVECNTKNGDVWFSIPGFYWQLSDRFPIDMPCEATEGAPFAIDTNLASVGHGFKSGEILITDFCGDWSNGLPMVVTIH